MYRKTDLNFLVILHNITNIFQLGFYVRVTLHTWSDVLMRMSWSYRTGTHFKFPRPIGVLLQRCFVPQGLGKAGYLVVFFLKRQVAPVCDRWVTTAGLCNIPYYEIWSVGSFLCCSVWLWTSSRTRFKVPATFIKPPAQATVSRKTNAKWFRGEPLRQRRQRKPLAWVQYRFQGFRRRSLHQNDYAKSVSWAQCYIYDYLTKMSS